MSDATSDDDNNDAGEAASPARFEEALTELEQLVEQLEGGDLSLEDSLQQFERGVGLARACRESLEAAEQKVQILLDQEGSSELSDYPGDADSEGQ